MIDGREFVAAQPALARALAALGEHAARAALAEAPDDTRDAEAQTPPVADDDPA